MTSFISFMPLVTALKGMNSLLVRRAMRRARVVLPQPEVPRRASRRGVGFDLNAEGFAGAEEFFLADEFVEGAGTHALGERLEAAEVSGSGRPEKKAHVYLECKWFGRE